MGTLYLVRHGQASLGADNYDQLSPLGERQCRRLGEYLKARGQHFDHVITGTLQRHVQSHEAIALGLDLRHEPLLRPGLNEYDSAAIIATVATEPSPGPVTDDRYRRHMRYLRQGLEAWMNGSTQPAGMPGYREFATGVAQVLDEVRSMEGHILLVSSGGPISAAMGQVLGVDPVVTIDLNMRIRNSSITEFTFNARRHLLDTYNALPHLDGAAYADWITYA
jgi:broad specificity phosphatase PhoE